MFHLILGLMVMGAVFAMILVLLIPLCLGPFVQILIAIFSKEKLARWIPGCLGFLGLLGSLYFFCLKEAVFPWWGVLFYWIVYGLLLWGVHAIVCRIKEWIRRGQEQ